MTLAAMPAPGERLPTSDERAAVSAVFSPLYQQIKSLLVAALERARPLEEAR